MSDPFFEAAYAEVVRVCQPDDTPSLTHGDGINPDPAQEVDSVIIAARRGILWMADTYLKLRQIVLPTASNGLTYEVIQAGVTGSTEPVWTYYQPWNPTSITLYDNGVIYRGYGDDSTGIYDVREACKQACLLKARKAARCVDFTADGVSIKNSQLKQFWIDESKRFEAVCVA